MTISSHFHRDSAVRKPLLTTLARQGRFPGSPTRQYTQEPRGHSPPPPPGSSRTKRIYLSGVALLTGLVGPAHLPRIRDGQAVQGADGHVHNPLSPEPLHHLRLPHVHVGAMAQPEVVTFAPAESTVSISARFVSPREDSCSGLRSSAAGMPHGARRRRGASAYHCSCW